MNKTPEEVSKDIGQSAREGILGLSLKFPSIFDQIPKGKIPGNDQHIPGSTIPDFPNHPATPGDMPPFLPPNNGNDPGWGKAPFDPGIDGRTPNSKYPDAHYGGDSTEPIFTPRKPNEEPDSGFKGGSNDHASAPKIDPRQILDTKSNRKPDPIETQE